jgi:hypothetical protein
MPGVQPPGFCGWSLARKDQGIDCHRRCPRDSVVGAIALRAAQTALMPEAPLTESSRRPFGGVAEMKAGAAIAHSALAIDEMHELASQSQ